MSATAYRLFIPVAPGLEHLLLEEIVGLGLTKAKKRGGGVSVTGPRETLWNIAFRSGMADGLRVRLGFFDAKDFKALEAGIKRLPWAAYIQRGAALVVRATAHKSALYHTGAIEERVSRHARSRLGSIDRSVPEATIHIRNLHDRVTVSLDLAGERMHRRGDRRYALPVSIRESLAAACVRDAAIPATTPLWDPFCGAGTMLMEAERLATGDAPGRKRNFAFEQWPSHDDAAFAAARAALPAAQPSGRTLYGSDRDGAAVDAAQQNLNAGGWLGGSRLAQGDFETIGERIPAGTAIIANLPYGVKTRSGPELQDTFRRFGAFLERRKDLGPVFVIDGNPEFRDLTRLPWKTRLTFKNRGLKVAWRMLVP